jgi:hypothetical protein
LIVCATAAFTISIRTKRNRQCIIFMVGLTW